MTGSDLSCRLVARLLPQWQQATLLAGENERYEQHLLLCPPCLGQHDKARAALRALRSAAATGPTDALVAELVAVARRRSEQPR
jgi:hypothetical protein